MRHYTNKEDLCYTSQAPPAKVKEDDESSFHFSYTETESTISSDYDNLPTFEHDYCLPFKNVLRRIRSFASTGSGRKKSFYRSNSFESSLFKLPGEKTKFIDEDDESAAEFLRDVEDITTGNVSFREEDLFRDVQKLNNFAA